MLGLDNPIHIAFLLVILLLVFGAKRLPEMGRSLGAGLRGFKESISGEAPGSEPRMELTAPGEAPPSPQVSEHSEPAMREQPGVRGATA
jgi:sec-independent protein translocase protein TatA